MQFKVIKHMYLIRYLHVTKRHDIQHFAKFNLFLIYITLHYQLDVFFQQLFFQKRNTMIFYQIKK